MKPIRESEASSYRCPVKSGMCTGNKCMAWKYTYTYTEDQLRIMNSRTGMAALIPIAPSKRTDKGYCGMVK